MERWTIPYSFLRQSQFKDILVIRGWHLGVLSLVSGCNLVDYPVWEKSVLQEKIL